MAPQDPKSSKETYPEEGLDGREMREPYFLTQEQWSERVGAPHAEARLSSTNPNDVVSQTAGNPVRTASSMSYQYPYGTVFGNADRPLAATPSLDLGAPYQGYQPQTNNTVDSLLRKTLTKSLMHANPFISATKSFPRAGPPNSTIPANFFNAIHTGPNVSSPANTGTEQPAFVNVPPVPDNGYTTRQVPTFPHPLPPYYNNYVATIITKEMTGLERNPWATEKGYPPRFANANPVSYSDWDGCYNGANTKIYNWYKEKGCTPDELGALCRDARKKGLTRWVAVGMLRAPAGKGKYGGMLPGGYIDDTSQH